MVGERGFKKEEKGQDDDSDGGRPEGEHAEALICNSNEGR